MSEFDFLNFKILYGDTLLNQSFTLFNRSDFLVQNNEKYQFQLLKNEVILVQIAFSISENTAKSPFIGPYAGFEFLTTTINTEEFDWFIAQIKNYLSNKGIEKINIKQQPNFFQIPNYNDLFINLHKTQVEYNQHINLTIFNEENLHQSKKRKLKKLISNHFYASKIENPTEAQLHNAYELIAKNRHRKGFYISLDENSFGKLFQNQAVYHLFAVFTVDGKMVATSVAVLINTEIVYHFLPADDDEYLSESPSILLYTYIANYFKSLGFKIFDLGISSLKEIKNEGLITFKKQLGAENIDLITFEINLNSTITDYEINNITT